jgi:hypothetical protein
MAIVVSCQSPFRSLEFLLRVSVRLLKINTGKMISGNQAFIVQKPFCSSHRVVWFTQVSKYWSPPRNVQDLTKAGQHKLALNLRQSVSMDDFILFDLNESQSPYDGFNNNILDADNFGLFLIPPVCTFQSCLDYDRLILTEVNLGTICSNAMVGDGDEPTYPGFAFIKFVRCFDVHKWF